MNNQIIKLRSLNLGTVLIVFTGLFFCFVLKSYSLSCLFFTVLQLVKFKNDKNVISRHKQKGVLITMLILLPIVFVLEYHSSFLYQLFN